jgi:hypothetical protein
MHHDPTNTLVIALMFDVSGPTRMARTGDPCGQVETPRSTAPLPRRRFSPQQRASPRYSPHNSPHRRVASALIRRSPSERGGCAPGSIAAARERNRARSRPTSGRYGNRTNGAARVVKRQPQQGLMRRGLPSLNVEGFASKNGPIASGRRGATAARLDPLANIAHAKLVSDLYDFLCLVLQRRVF